MQTRPSFGLYFASGALANIPFWVTTGLLTLLDFEGFPYVILVFVVVLLGGMAGGRFLVSRLGGVPWITGLKAALAASLVNVFFGVGTFSADYSSVLILVMIGFLVGGPIGALIGARHERTARI